jgi:glutathione S-transferase
VSAFGLLPLSAHARADVLRWLFFAANHLQPWLSLLGQERLITARLGASPDRGVISLAERELARLLPVVEQAFAEREYLSGSYTLADIVVGCGLENCD